MWTQELLGGKATAKFEIVDNQGVFTVRGDLIAIMDAITDKIPGQLDDMALDTMAKIVVPRFSRDSTAPTTQTAGDTPTA